jgi:golgi phosphoprotein 3
VPRDLHLHEEILLLALHDEKGSFHSSMHSFALAGAVVTELLLDGRLRVVEGRRKRRYLEVADPTPTGDPVLDHPLGRVEAGSRREQVARWVTRLARERRPSLAHRVAEDLVEAGVLDRQEGRILGIFRRVRFPTAHPDPEDALVARLEAALERDEDPEPRTAVVLALAHSAGILRPNLDRSLLRNRKKRLEALSRMEGITGATRDAIQAAQAAVAAAVMAATVAASSG